MLEVARKLNVAVFCRFVDFPTFLKLSDDLSDDALCPSSYGRETPRASEASFPGSGSVWNDFFPLGQRRGSPVNDDFPHDPGINEQEVRNRSDLRQQAERFVG